MLWCVFPLLHQKPWCVSPFEKFGIKVCSWDIWRFTVQNHFTTRSGFICTLLPIVQTDPPPPSFQSVCLVHRSLNQLESRQTQCTYATHTCSNSHRNYSSRTLLCFSDLHQTFVDNWISKAECCCRIRNHQAHMRAWCWKELLYAATVVFNIKDEIMKWLMQQVLEFISLELDDCNTKCHIITHNGSLRIL